MMAELQALLFDVDGTLAETEADGHRVAFNRAFADAGLDWHWSEGLYGELLGVTGGKERIRRYMHNSHPDHLESLAPDEAAGFIAGLHQSKNRFYAVLAQDGRIPLRPGVRRLLREARDEGMRLAISTTTTMVNVASLLTHTLGPESLGWFEVIAAGDVVERKKPAPDIYFRVLEELELEPAQCLAFEDSRNGLRSALDAGLQTVVTVSQYTAGESFSEAAVVLNHLGEPDMPMTVLSADGNEASYVDMAWLRRLHGALF